MTLTDPDRTHFDRCWRIHQACAVARIEHLERLLDDQVAHARPPGWTDPTARDLPCTCRCVALEGQIAALTEVVNDLRGQLAMARATVTGHGRLT